MLKILLLSGPTTKETRPLIESDRPNNRNRYTMQYISHKSIKVFKIIRETKIKPTHTFLTLCVEFMQSCAYCRNYDKYDILFSNYELFALVPELVRKIFRQKKAAHITTSFMLTNLFTGSPRTQKMSRFIVGPLCKQLLNNIDLFIFYSKSQMLYFRNIFNVPSTKTRFIHLAIDTHYFTPKKGDDEYVLSVGRNSARDYETLITAFEGLKTKLQIVCTKNQKISKRYGENITIDYDIDYATLRKKYENAKFVVIPMKNAHTLAGQLVMLESFAMGKAVIATRCWGTEDYIIDGKNGLLVSPGDTEDLKEKIEYLIKNPKVAADLGKNARTFVEKNCSLDRYAENIYKLALEQKMKENT